MKLETACQVADLVSFLLVTPEFLSDNLLEKIANFSDRAQRALEPWANLTINIASVFFVAVLTISGFGEILHIKAIEDALLPITMGAGSGYSDIPIINYAVWITSGLGCVLGGAFIIVRITWLIARRGVLFWFGASLFLTSRGLSIWLSTRS